MLYGHGVECAAEASDDRQLVTSGQTLQDHHTHIGDDALQGRQWRTASVGGVSSSCRWAEEERSRGSIAWLQSQRRLPHDRHAHAAEVTIQAALCSHSRATLRRAQHDEGGRMRCMHAVTNAAEM
jgi:hypothetical protein